MPSASFDKPFFSPESFWNKPLPEENTIHPDTERWLGLLEEAQAEMRSGGFHINLLSWTIPVFEAGPETPRVNVGRKIDNCPWSASFHQASLPHLHPDHPFGHGPGFGSHVPIPPEAEPDGEVDGHLAIIDRDAGKIFEMWQVRRRDDGGWETSSGYVHELDGSGVLEPISSMQPGESVHMYGPCRASGVPAVAGLIMQWEIEAGQIGHKLCFATNVCALGEFVHPPAIWCDGFVPGGIPQGSIIQLDPALDLDAFPLGRGAKAIARALQVYGAVACDVAGGVTLYGENLNPHAGRTWDGLLGEDDLSSIPFHHYRFLQTGGLRAGMSRPDTHPHFGSTFRARFPELTREFQSRFDRSL